MLELVLALVLIGGKAAGDLAGRLRQPVVVGKVLVGLALGPVVSLLATRLAGPAGLADLRNQLTLMSGLGVVWLLFLAGLETEADKLRAQGRAGTIVAFAGVAATMALVMLASLLLGLPPRTGLLLGVTLAATSVTISAQTLLEMGRLNTPVGMTVLGAAVIDDVIGLVTFSLVAAALTGNIADLPIRAGELVGFGALVIVVVRWAGRPLLRWSSGLQTREAGLAVGFALALLLAAAAKGVGMAAITGAYVGGLTLSRHAGEQLREGARVIVYGFFLPIFLVNVGLSAASGDLVGGLVPGAILAVAGMTGKTLGCGLAARLAGVPTRGAVAVGVGMIPLGEVALVLAAFGSQMRLLSPSLLAAVVLVVVVTSLVAPVLLRLVISREPVLDPVLVEA